VSSGKVGKAFGAPAGGGAAQLAGVSETGVLAGQTPTVPVAALTGTVAGGLHRLVGATPGSGTTAVGAAGRYVVGTEGTANGATAAVRWDADTGQVLSRLSLPDTGLTPTAVNRAGQVTVGALVWSPSGRTWLAPTSAAPMANAIADDGRVGGRSLRDGQQVATIWTCVPAHGLVRAPAG
jgi:hypothetical protein